MLIVDSGSTKADWALLKDQSEPVMYSSIGINPTFHDESFILSILNNHPELSQIAGSINKVHFFGAGCSSKDACQIVAIALKRFFQIAEISVEHDMKAAVLATCGDHAGIASIIGTGSNACYFDGTDILSNNFGLGHVLGDEASGSYLGKKIITHFLYGLLPKDLEWAFNQKYKLKREEVIDHVYHQTGANVWLASFSSFYSEHKKHQWVQQTIKDSFETFLDLFVLQMPNHEKTPVHFIGSIAYHYQDLLVEVLNKKKLIKGKIIQKPIDELAAYFQKKEQTLQ